MFSKSLAVLALCMSMVIAGCGGGSGGTGGGSVNASVTLAVDKATVGTGSTFTATVTVSSPTAKAYNGLEVKVLSDNEAVIPSGKGYCNNLGVANITLQPLNSITTTKTVNLVAEIDGVRSASIPVSVTVPKLAITPSADSTFTVAKGTPAGSLFRVVMKNLTATFMDSLGNPIQNQNITVSVDTINNQAIGDQVVFFPSTGAQVTAPPGTITLATDSTGSVTIPLSVDIITSSAGNQHVITAVWRATALTKGVGTSVLTYTVTGSTQVTVVTPAD